MARFTTSKSLPIKAQMLYLVTKNFFFPFLFDYMIRYDTRTCQSPSSSPPPSSSCRLSIGSLLYIAVNKSRERESERIEKKKSIDFLVRRLSAAVYVLLIDPRETRLLYAHSYTQQRNLQFPKRNKRIF